MVYFMENPIRMDFFWGYTHFIMETSIFGANIGNAIKIYQNRSKSFKKEAFTLLHPDLT